MIPDVARVFYALGDPTRRALVEAVTDAPLSVSRLAEHLGVTLTAVGQHVQVLEEAGLVKTEKIGRTRTCQLDQPGLEALKLWISNRRSPLEQKLDRLGDLLDGDA
ncbi:metalloregulator ArsR/SmtB family transcription factor [Asticcacaulis sp. EMRT-3]|uniref:ArsR/SmtB family transcription factor n=1 Tax=Asticcacaulis sp. EMRT-3 TaxID=3040349 RepID=UPI0024AFBFBD|nr:metalloregulator ArsR/SmtB family transcription factor [Asticcacaulis sp. EMRT-3]MDI7775165.1 metalloregulator ArsR/SmtB family transcription factor [Asticcacaulis sp. EMRT-3]